MATRIVKVQVKGDHLQGLTRRGHITDRIAELVWNGLDADAPRVEVTLVRQAIDGVESIEVYDRGHGIDPDSVDEFFTSLGGSWKAKQQKTRGLKRILHGKYGRGRFSALGLGKRATWTTVFVKQPKGPAVQYEIQGSELTIESFEISPPVEVPGTESWTRVIIEDLHAEAAALRTEAVVESLRRRLAIYLLQYPNVEVTIDGFPIDPKLEVDAQMEVDLGEVMPNGDGKLLVIHWKYPGKSSIFLCSPDGFTRQELPLTLPRGGGAVSAYLRSPALDALDDAQLPIVTMGQGDVGKALEHCQKFVVDFLRKRLAETAGDRVARWKREQIYPYRRAPKDVVEEAEQEVFNICALSIDDFLPGFRDAPASLKKLQFQLLREALRDSPDALHRILGEVLSLSSKQKDDLAALLKQTSLGAVISTAKLVADRMNFTAGLETYLFADDYRSVLKERSQLHRLLAENCWIFGEQFSVLADDEGMTKVLDKHLGLLGRSERCGAPVRGEDGEVQIVDLMLSRTVPQPQPDRHHHFVVELKRPTVKINHEVALQLAKYASTVARDERFFAPNTKWTFIAVGNEIEEGFAPFVQPDGQFMGTTPAQNVDVKLYVFPWSRVLGDCKGRMEFVRSRLECKATAEDGLSFMRETFAQYVPAPASPA
jgi:hypothetical protein